MWFYSFRLLRFSCSQLILSVPIFTDHFFSVQLFWTTKTETGVPQLLGDTSQNNAILTITDIRICSQALWGLLECDSWKNISNCPYSSLVTLLAHGYEMCTPMPISVTSLLLFILSLLYSMFCLGFLTYCFLFIKRSNKKLWINVFKYSTAQRSRESTEWIPKKTVSPLFPLKV
jgi:hypothetical protein